MAALYGQRTFAQIVAKIGLKILGPNNTLSTTSNPTLADVKDTVNTYYKYLFSRGLYIWGRKDTTFNTVGAQQNYTMPDDVMTIDIMSVPSLNSPIVRVPSDILRSNFPGAFVNFGSTLPRYYTDAQPASNNAQVISLWPIPDTVYNIYMKYQARFIPLSADGDYSVVPPEFEDYLYEGPLGELFTQLGDPKADWHMLKAREIDDKCWLANQKLMLQEPLVVQPWTDLLWPTWVR